MARFKYFIFLFLVISPSLFAEKLPEAMRIGINPDSEYTNILKNNIVHSYHNLGIKVKFIESPPKRGAIELEKGNLDALLIRLSSFESITENSVKVPFLLTTGYLVLYCKEGLICDDSVLNDPLKVIGILSGKNFMSLYLNQFSASIYEVDSSLQLSQMLAFNRLDYVMSFEVDGFGDYTELDTTMLNVYRLKKFEAFHYVHKRWKNLVPKISKSLALTMQELGPPIREE